MREGSLMQQYYHEHDDPKSNVLGRFAYYDLLDLKASREADEPRHNRIVVLWTKVAGSIDEAPIKVKPGNQAELRHRFPRAWKAFNSEAGAEEVPGTPVATMPGIDDDRRQKMWLAGVYTVEQVANLSDAQCESLGFGFRKLREQAQAMLAEQHAGPPGRPPRRAPPRKKPEPEPEPDLSPPRTGPPLRIARPVYPARPPSADAEPPAKKSPRPTRGRRGTAKASAKTPSRGKVASPST